MEITQIIVVIVASFIGYTVCLVLSLRKRQSAINYLALALFFDYWGTVKMYLLSGAISWTSHTVLGILALLMMTTLFIISVIKQALAQKTPTKLLRLAYPPIYILWLISFILGLLEHTI